MPTTRRTVRQQQANAFDCDLYRLIHRALELGDDKATPRSERAKWTRIAQTLSGARPDVRAMMHVQDVQETV